MIQVTSPRRTSQRRAVAQRLDEPMAAHRTVQGAEAIADVGSLLEPLLGGEARHLHLERLGDDRTDRRVRVSGGGSHGGVVRRAVGDPGARTLGDAELGGAARNRVGGTGRATARAGSSIVATAAPR